MPGGIHAPIEVMLTWPTPNYVNPITRSNAPFIVACVCSPITIIMLIARLWVRIFHQRNPGLDDWLLVAGTVFAIATTVLITRAIHIGFDRHIWDYDMFKNPEGMVTTRKHVLGILCTFVTASGLIKISILLFYRRLSLRVISVRFRLITWLAIGFIAAYSIALTIAPIFGCHPISAFWDQVDGVKLLHGYKYRCFDEGADVFSASVFSAAQDLITTVLPTLLFWNLRIPVRQKIALFGIFAIGYGAAALGIMRAYYTWIIYYETYDVTWVAWKSFMVTMIELHVGCFCANAPTLKVFFKHFFRDKLAPSAKKPDGLENQGQKKNESSGAPSSKSSTSVFKDKFSTIFSKGSSTYSRDGYLSEPHADVTVDSHGGVQVQREPPASPSTTSSIGTEPTRQDLRGSLDTMDMICAQYYYGDIEMGCFTTGQNSQTSSLHPHDTVEDADIKTLPEIPQKPRLPRSFMSFQGWSRSPRLSTHPDWPACPFPARIAEPRNEDGSRSHLCLPGSNNLEKSKCQSWT